MVILLFSAILILQSLVCNDLGNDLISNDLDTGGHNLSGSSQSGMNNEVFCVAQAPLLGVVTEVFT